MRDVSSGCDTVLAMKRIEHLLYRLLLWLESKDSTAAA